MTTQLTATGQPNLSSNSNIHRGSFISQVTVPAKVGNVAGVNGIPSFGTAFYLVQSTADINVKTEKTVFKSYKQGTGERFTPEFEFQRLEFENQNAFAVTVFIWYGFGEYIDRRFELLEKGTITKGSTVTSIGAGADETFNGSPSGNEIRRKAILITNKDTTNSLDLEDEDGNPLGSVFPLNNFLLNTSGYVKVVNNTGSGISCNISELWYSTL